MNDHDDTGTAVVIALTRIETKLDTVTTGHGDHETRIRLLERKIWIAAGITGAVAAGGATFLQTVLL